MSEAADIREITLGPGHRLQLRTGMNFITIETGILQVNLLPSEARKLGTHLISAADRCESQSVAKALAHG